MAKQGNMEPRRKLLRTNEDKRRCTTVIRMYRLPMIEASLSLMRRTGKPEAFPQREVVEIRRIQDPDRPQRKDRTYPFTTVTRPAAGEERSVPTLTVDSAWGRGDRNRPLHLHPLSDRPHTADRTARCLPPALHIYPVAPYAHAPHGLAGLSS